MEMDKQPGQFQPEVEKRNQQIFEECMQILTAAIASTQVPEVIKTYLQDVTVVELLNRVLAVEGADQELLYRVLVAIERSLNFGMFEPQNLDYSIREKIQSSNFD